MWLWLAVCVLSAAVYGGGGVTQTSGIEQFWTDDYKIFEQVYGKTSDKDLFGATLPPNIEFGSDTKATQASEKKERYLQNFQKDIDEYDSYNSGEKFNLLLTHAALKPKKPSFNFIGYNDFKPISQDSDPETYNYLKHLEKVEKEKISHFPIGLGGFKPYINTAQNPEETDAYKSIQDILDAHEANKGDDDDEDSKYLTYRSKGKKKKPARNNEPKPARNKNSKPRCLPGRCRKRSSSYRVRSNRPYIRRIKQRIIY